MTKSPDAFRTISEVAEWLGVQAHVLRFWESKFSQVRPVKRAGGRRYYRPNDMLLLGGIKKLLHDDGLTIKGVQKILREQGVGHVQSVSRPLRADAEEPLDSDGTVVRFRARPDTGVIDATGTEEIPAEAAGAPVQGDLPIGDPEDAAEPGADSPTPQGLPSANTASAADAATADEDGAATPRPLTVEVPHVPPEEAFLCEPGILALLADRDAIRAGRHADLAPVAAALKDWLARVEAR